MANKSNEVTGWTGWIGFASVMLYLAGFFHIVAGFAALIEDEVYVLTKQAIWILDITQWGWIHILGGLLAIWAGSSLLRGGGYGRTVAVIVAVFSAVANMAFFHAAPIWSLMIIVIDIFVIYAVVVHGSELKD